MRVLTLARPEVRNALSVRLLLALDDALVRADDDPSVRVVVLTGEGTAFCAGLDLTEAADPGSGLLDALHELRRVGSMSFLHKPLVGAVNGPAVTGGLELALGCDVLLASSAATFRDTHARVGLVPVGGLTARLPALVGPQVARLMSLSGAVLDAPRAWQLGLVAEFVPPEVLLPRALQLAGEIAACDPAAVRAIKGLYDRGWATTPVGVHAAERAASAGQRL